MAYVKPNVTAISDISETFSPLFLEPDGLRMTISVEPIATFHVKVVQKDRVHWIWLNQNGNVMHQTVENK
jgi:hypothetical protein